MNNLESNDESVDTPLVSPFPHSDNDLDDDEVLNELSEYENARVLCRERIINSFDEDDLAFQSIFGFRKFTAYLDPFLPMNIISHNAYNTIMVEGLETTGKNLVDITRDVYVILIRRILEVLRKFHWTNLGGRSNQLSYVSSPLLSKPGEY
nr:hypothetical protein [Tanacetum cinerariifolium]